ncbi:MAG TPA: PD-(D/E)XK nuclease family protein [Mucilaginibacter sp.]|jgi:hypothetical protein
MDLQTLREAYQKFLKSTEVERLALELKQPNFFNILKIEHTELRHSNFLAWLLDPKGSHGLGETLTKKLFIELLFNEMSPDINDRYLNEIDYANIKIYREWNNIDILLKCPAKGNRKDSLIVCIENKVRSIDSVGQLDKYEKIIKDNFPSETHELIFVYLTIAGDKPTKISGTSTYINLSYKYLVQALDGIMEIYKENIIPKIKFYIQDYLQTIKRNYMKEDDKAVEYARKIYNDHKDLFDFITSNGIENKLPLVAEQFCIDNNLKLIGNKDTWFSFIPNTWVESMDKLKKADPTSRGEGYPMAFEFNKWKENLYLTLIVYPFADQDLRKRFIDAIKSVATFKSRNLKAIDKILQNEKDAKWTTLHSGKKEVGDWANIEIINRTCNDIYDLEKDTILNDIVIKTTTKLTEFI